MKMCELRVEANVENQSCYIEMNSSSPEEVTFTTGEKFRSFSELKDKVEDFEKANFIQLYIR